MPKPTLADSGEPRVQISSKRPVRFVIITLDNHLAGAAERANAVLARENPGLELRLHAASDWSQDPEMLARCHADIAQADIIFANMLFMEEHIEAVLPQLKARRETCDAMVGCISAGEVIKVTKLGRFDMSKPQSGPMALLKRLRGKSSKTDGSKSSSNGASQMAMLRRLPKILRFVPGTAQDVRAYFLCMQYWLSSSAENLLELARYLTARYASGDDRAWCRSISFQPPHNHPECGLYHPKLRERLTEDAGKIAALSQSGVQGKPVATIGLLIMRSYVLAEDTAHYDAVIQALEERGFIVLPVFASGLDSRPAIEQFLMEQGRTKIDALVSLTGFSLVGGPAYNDTAAAEATLAALNVPYFAAQAVEFQDLAQWRASQRGLMPVEATMMVAIPELDGATNPIVYGGRAPAGGQIPAKPGIGKGQFGKVSSNRAMQPAEDRVEVLANRVAQLIRLRQKPVNEREIAIVLFNFPPNAGGTGTAAYLAVYRSLFNTLKALAAEGYDVALPESADALRTAILEGNAAQYGTDANVHCLISADDHVRREKHLAEIESQWGPAPGRVGTNGRALFIQGLQLGKIFIGIQPNFGYEGDPMRLLFERNFAPTHSFSAFYRYLREDMNADAVLHFGMHGALEFMPGKQVGLEANCWPDRLIGALPNFYLYAANNPSEGTLAKRRSAATMITYRTPPLAAAGLYRGLLDLKASLNRWRGLPPSAASEQAALLPVIQEQAALLDLCAAEPAWTSDDLGRVNALHEQVLELEYSLIPHGLHVVGEIPSREERADLLFAIAENQLPDASRKLAEAIADGGDTSSLLPRKTDQTTRAMVETLIKTNRELCANSEIDGILRALDGQFIKPVAGGDLLRSPDILPTGRNLHGFDPFRLPSAFAVKDGQTQSDKLLARHLADGGRLPETIAIVLWGTDNLKSEGGPIGQALALLGAQPRFDAFGRLCGASLIPLRDVGRPRIDVLMTLSGIFRDLLPLQSKLLAEAAYLAACADEPIDQNYVRKHALAYQAKHGCDLETAALRVFSNADGAYGANVNYLIDNGHWEDEDELADAYAKRKCFAYGRDGKAARQSSLLESVLGDVQVAYQNLESVEVGVTTIDHYFDTLGGISQAVKRSKGNEIPVYIGDQTRGEGKVRTLGEQVAIETRTRMLNPKWYEGMLEHGYEGVRQIEAHVTNTMGWSATTGQVDPWVYKQITQTYILDADMRERMAKHNPKASARVASRLLEAHERQYWEPDEATLNALREAGDEFEDRIEGVSTGAAA